MTGSVQDDPKYQAGGPPEPGSVAVDVVISSDTRRANRIPPGQVRTRKWPVLHGTTVPDVPIASWSFAINGLVERPLTFTWEEFQTLPRRRVFADFHCVTRWSRLGNLWEGVSLKHLLGLAGVKPAARYVIATAYDSDWTTNLPLAEVDVDDALVADRHDSEPLSADHGGPARLIVPRLYAWKSAKWLKSLTLLENDQPGYWEELGYHNYGDPWREERYTE
jgi:DMSO/TMAO reductase YedYZ molybdopterin-dependent catalytic subunit